MYGFWRLGLSPAPSAGADAVAKGEATNTSRIPKKLARAAMIETVQGRTSRVSRPFSATAAEPIPVRTRNQRSREPCCPPQKAAAA